MFQSLYHHQAIFKKIKIRYMQCMFMFTADLFIMEHSETYRCFIVILLSYYFVFLSKLRRE